MASYLVMAAWATFIHLGWKTIETRTHRRFDSSGHRMGFTQPKWDKDWEEIAGSYLMKYEIDMIKRNKNEIPRGQILCTAFVKRVDFLEYYDSKKALIDCNPAHTLRRGLFLEKIVDCHDWNIKIKGHQGIWNYKGVLPSV